MLKNYIKIAWRNLWKHKLFSGINIFGLALSLGVCILVIDQVYDDLSYDLFHPHPARTYRILSAISEFKKNKSYELASTPLPLKNALAKETDIIQAATQVYPALKAKAVNGDKELYINGAFSDPSFFKIFGFQLSAGNKQTALAQTNGIVLSSETAMRFFGKNNPIGQFLQFEKLGLFQVTGVLAKPAGKSHLDFDAYASTTALFRLEKENLLAPKSSSWNSMNDAYTYVLLKNGVSQKTFDQKLRQIALIPELKNSEGKINFISQPLSKITPGTDGLYNEIGSGTVWEKVLTIIGVGLIILLAAGFNYTNLTIARALSRAKEVGIRKVSGAQRYQIFIQYIMESIMLSFLALALACFLLSQYKSDLVYQPKLMIMVFLFTLLTGILAGAFPAWILSSFKPVMVLKGLQTQKLFGNISLQKGLMIFQFSLSLVVIIFLSVYYRQFSYLKILNPGFTSKNILTVPYSAKNQVFSNEIAKISGVEGVSRNSESFGMRGSGSVQVFLNKPNGNQGVNCDFYFTDAASIPMYQLKLIAGNNFPENEDFDQEKFVIINEKTASLLKFNSPVDAVGKTLWLNDSTQVEIKGVVKDFYDKGAARYQVPLVLRNQSQSFNYLNIQIDAANRNTTLSQIENIWHQLNPHTAFTSEWLDKRIANREDQTDAYTTLGFLASITITIASLGLLGLVVYTVETRRKEISIRKIIGASTNQLMVLLSKGFIKLLLIAGLIAVPLAYIGCFLFLQNFANRVPLGIGTLLLSFLFLLSIGLLTILSHTYKAASEKPADNLRAE